MLYDKPFAISSLIRNSLNYKINSRPWAFIVTNYYDDESEVLKKIPFIELVEMENNRNEASCCGVSAYISCSEESKKLQEKRINEAVETGAEYLLTSCPKCLAHLNCYLNEHKELKNKIIIMDIVSFLGKLLFLI